jgi:hypothetical protein
MAYSDQVNRTVDSMTDSTNKARAESMNVAVATLICTYCEALGSHLRGCQRETGESMVNFTAFVRSYLSGFMACAVDASGAKRKNVRVIRDVEPPRPTDHAALEYPEILYKKFRCGFAHELLPKYGSGIIKNSESEHYPYLIDRNLDYDLILNLTLFGPDFVAAAARFRADVLADNQVSLIELSGTTSSGLASSGTRADSS